MAFDASKLAPTGLGCCRSVHNAHGFALWMRELAEADPASVERSLLRCLMALLPFCSKVVKQAPLLYLQEPAGTPVESSRCAVFDGRQLAGDLNGQRCPSA